MKTVVDRVIQEGQERFRGRNPWQGVPSRWETTESAPDPEELN
jgi:hypothetical protein